MLRITAVPPSDVALCVSELPAHPLRWPFESKLWICFVKSSFFFLYVGRQMWVQTRLRPPKRSPLILKQRRARRVANPFSRLLLQHGASRFPPLEGACCQRSPSAPSSGSTGVSSWEKCTSPPTLAKPKINRPSWKQQNATLSTFQNAAELRVTSPSRPSLPSPWTTTPTVSAWSAFFWWGFEDFFISDPSWCSQASSWIFSPAAILSLPLLTKWRWRVSSTLPSMHLRRTKRRTWICSPEIFWQSARHPWCPWTATARAARSSRNTSAGSSGTTSAPSKGATSRARTWSTWARWRCCCRPVSPGPSGPFLLRLGQAHLKVGSLVF